MTVLVAVASILVFVLALGRSGVVSVSGAVLAEMRRASLVLRDRALDDLAKERAARRAALRLFGASAGILLRGGVVVGLAFLPIWIADLAGLAPAGAVLDWLMRPEVIVVASLVLLGGWLAGRRLWPRS